MEEVPKKEKRRAAELSTRFQADTQVRRPRFRRGGKIRDEDDGDMKKKKKKQGEKERDVVQRNQGQNQKAQGLQQRRRILGGAQMDDHQVQPSAVENIRGYKINRNERKKQPSETASAVAPMALHGVDQGVEGRHRPVAGRRITKKAESIITGPRKLEKRIAGPRIGRLGNQTLARHTATQPPYHTTHESGKKSYAL